MKYVFYIFGILFILIAALFAGVCVGGFVGDYYKNHPKVGIVIAIIAAFAYLITIIASERFRNQFKHPILWSFVIIAATVLFILGYYYGYFAATFVW